MTLPSKLPRRFISWPALHIAVVALIVLAIPALALLAAIDLARGRWRLNFARVYALGLAIVTVEFVLFWAGIVTAVVTADGRLISHDRWLRINFWLQDRWVAAQIGAARITTGLKVEVENLEVAEEANAIIMARHLSHADALFPALVYGVLAGHDLRYMVKQELQWPPAMDLIGNRLPHVWIDRAPGPDSPLLAIMRRAAEDVDETTVACIFPEGTFFTLEGLDRAIDRLRETRPDLAEPAATLRHVLPPRPAGSVTLLAGAPTADVVVLGHIGLEAFSSIRDIIRAVPISDPVLIHLWRHRRADIPSDADDQATWLVLRWLELDAWISERLAG
jgi:1-acyl-sn-glycerol-3-phosphate acyltransferase